MAYPRIVTIANVTNGEGSVIIVIVFSAIAATVIFVRLYLRARQRDSQKAAQLNLLERIEGMTNEEFEAWRAEGRRQRETAIKYPEAGRSRRRHRRA
jgi:hypothetical protein